MVVKLFVLYYHSIFLLEFDVASLPLILLSVMKSWLVRSPGLITVLSVKLQLYCDDLRRQSPLLIIYIGLHAVKFRDLIQDF